MVDSRYQGQGIGSALLERAEVALKADGAERIALGTDVWYYFPGLPIEFIESADWFEKRGYTNVGEVYDLIGRYDHKIESPIPDLKNVEFTLLKAEEEDAFVDFMRRSFPGRWEYAAIQYFKRGGTGREFVVLKKDKEICGFCRINDSESPVIGQNVYWSPLFSEPLGGLGPLGIDDNLRGKGYGLAIVEAGVHFLRKRNIHSIVIDYTPYLGFYGKLGFEPHQKYVNYIKEL